MRKKNRKIPKSWLLSIYRLVVLKSERIIIFTGYVLDNDAVDVDMRLREIMLTKRYFTLRLRSRYVSGTPPYV